MKNYFPVIKSGFSVLRRLCLAGLALGLALAAAGQATLPYITDFDSSLGFTTGPLNGQQNWLVLSGSADVTNTTSLLGNQSVVLEPGPAAPEIGIPFAVPSSAQPIVYVDCILKPVASSSISSFIYLDTSLAVLVRNDGAGGGQIFTLDGSLGWVPTPAVFAINNSNNTASDWMRLTFRLDFAAKTWDLYYNGKFAAHDVAFLDDSLTYLPFFIFQGDPTAPSYLNLLYAGPANLLFTDANNDGIDDAWETAHGLSLSVNQRDLDPDGDGLTNLQEYISGTDPNNADTDGDGLNDGQEIALGRNPLVSDPDSFLYGLGGGGHLRLYLKADTGVNTDPSGLVTTWADQSGLGNNAYQDQFHSPQPIAGAMNGHSVLHFNDANDALRLPDVMNGASAGEIFIVTRLADFSNPVNNGLCQFGDGGGTAYSSAHVWDDFGTTNEDSYGGPGSTLLIQSHIYNSSVGADGTSTLRFNGTVSRSLTGQTVDFDSGPLLGADWFGEHYNGDIAEVIVYDRVLSNAERLALTHYLNDKYALGIVFDTTPPTTPTGLNASVVTASSFTLNWTASTDNKQVLNYDILRDGVVIGSSSTTSFNVTGLSALGTYGVTVVARDTSGNVSAASATLSVTTKAAMQAPTGLTTTSVGAGSVMVSWTAQSTDAGVTSYNVYNNGALAGTTTTTSFTLTGLVPTASQNITVVAVDAGGHTSTSSTGLSVTTPDGSSTGAQSTYAFIILPNGYVPGGGNMAYPSQAGISDNGIALLFDPSFHTAYRWQSGAIQTLSDPGYNLEGPEFINRTGTIALTAQPPSNPQLSIYNQGPYRADVWLPDASAPQIVQGSTFSGTIVGGVSQNPNGPSPRYYSGAWLPTVFSNDFLLRGLSDDNRVWFNDIDPSSCDAGQVFQSSYPEQGTYRYVDVLVDRSFSSSGGGRTPLGLTHWSYSWPPIGGNYQYLDFPVMSFNPDPILMGVGASGITINEGLGTGSNPATWYVGSQAVDYEPVFINKNGTVLGRTSGSNYAQQTFTLVLPDGTRHDLPSSNYPTYFWVDDQDRPHGYDSSYDYFLLQPQTVNGQFQYQGISYALLPPPVAPPPGWAILNHPIPPDIQRPEMGVVKNPATQEQHTFIAFPMGISVDANRDGIISLSREGNFDNTTAAQPYRFWLNDEVDGYSSAPGESQVQDSLGSGISNWLGHQVTCTRDLQNFARMWIDMKGTVAMLTAPTNTLQIGLKWQNVTGSPAINIYASADTTGSTSYLTDPSGTAEQAQIAVPFGQAITDKNGKQTVDTTGTFILPASVWSGLTDANPVGHFLFEGAGEGTGQLTLVILDANGNELGTGPSVYLDLKDIKELYERWTVGDGNGGAPASIAGISTDRLPSGVQGLQYSSGSPGLSVPGDPTQNAYILFVHGWNMPPWEKDAFAETALKRLYWQGYKGKFGTFQWPTTYSSSSYDWFNNAQEITSYDDGEFSAWQSAVPLRQLLGTLHGSYGSSVYLLAHSMGNVVAGEALRIAGQSGAGQLVNTYVATQAAVPGHCYDPSLTGNDLLELGIPVTANIYNNWLVPPSSSVGVRSNYYNVNDFALSYWQLDQSTKPDVRTYTYYYSGFPNDNPAQDLFSKALLTVPVVVGAVPLHLGNPNNVQDRYQIMAYAAQPRSLALGAVPDMSSAAFATSQNLQSPSIWPPDTFAPDNQPKNQYAEHQWHSAEFRFTYTDQANYWNALMKRFGLPTNQ